MPIPKPKKNERQSDFIPRCMKDRTMIREYEVSQRYVVCLNEFKNRNKHKEEKSDKEFAEGKENYCPRCYFEKDLKILREECDCNK